MKKSVATKFNVIWELGLRNQLSQPLRLSSDINIKRTQVVQSGGGGDRVQGWSQPSSTSQNSGCVVEDLGIGGVPGKPQPGSSVIVELGLRGLSRNQPSRNRTLSELYVYKSELCVRINYVCVCVATGVVNNINDAS